MKVIYQAASYDPEKVTGHYVRCVGKKPHYRFRVFETSTLKGKPGMGPTLREYDCDGSELPEELKARCIKSKQTEKWTCPTSEK